MLINITIPTVVSILTFMRRKNSILGLSEPENEFLDIFTLMSCTEHENCFIALGPGIRCLYLEEINCVRASVYEDISYVTYVSCRGQIL